jgi:AAA family ATP:ADP antiporter
MPHTLQHPSPAEKTWLDRALSVFADVRPGEAATAVLMLLNVFLLLVCYSVIKTVREPLILLGGGAEVRSYAAAGQALLLMGFVPLYSWFASRVDRVRLLVGGTAFFIGCIEVFALAVGARVPYVGVAFFIWVGIFNISLVAQFWSFANDLYTRDAGDRLFPIIMIGMTAGAPVGSFTAARLFRMGLTPPVILQVSGALLAVSALLYLAINRRESARPAPSEPVSAAGGFRLVLRSRYLGLIALLVVLLNVVNTTGEYLVSRLLTAHVQALAQATPGFNRQAFIGAFSGEYQFWVNVTALVLQAFVTSRLVRYQGLRGVLLALPLIALGGYAIVAAGVGFSVVRWIKTAENATDYSVMNTARQLLWLTTSRDEKYKAKQAIDTFFVRAGDVISAGVVYAGTAVLHLEVRQFAMANIVMTILWMGVALLILQSRRVVLAWPRRRTLTAAAAGIVLLTVAGAPAAAQETRAERLAAERADKATRLHPYEPDRLERQIERVDRLLLTRRSVYTFLGSAYDGGGLAVGPGYRAHVGDTGTIDAHAAWSIRNFKVADAAIGLPVIAGGRLRVSVGGTRIDAPRVAFYGIGRGAPDVRGDFQYRAATIGSTARLRIAGGLSAGGGIDALAFEATGVSGAAPRDAIDPRYYRTRTFAEYDTRTSPDYSRQGGLYRVEWSGYRQRGGSGLDFSRVDVQAQRFIPILREIWVIALRALASTTRTAAGNDVPYVLLPDLGGSHSLRGFPDGRFRDRHRVLLTGEYRWTAGPFVDMAVFMDAGKVAAHRADLDLRHLETSQGVGLSIHTPNATVLRMEVARSRAGTALTFSFSPNF